MLGVVLTLCLVIIAVAWLSPSHWDCLVCLNKVVWTPVLVVLFANKLLGVGRE